MIPRYREFSFVRWLAWSVVLGMSFAVSLAQGSIIAVTKPVLGTSMPWTYVGGGLNTGYQYGVLDGSGPVVFSFSDGYDFTPGGTLTITYVSGLVDAFGVAPIVDSQGYLGSPFKNDDPGSTGQGFPSFYTPADWDTYLMALIGVFTDNSGAIVSTPFAVGLSRSVTIPVGATQLQLGFNDDLFVDNLGAMDIRVEGPQAVNQGGVVPEPTTWMVWTLLGISAVVPRCWQVSRRRLTP